jgi:hypothetical protein
LNAWTLCLDIKLTSLHSLQGLDVQNDIDGKNERRKKYKPGQYFVLKFDFFSPFQVAQILQRQDRKLIKSLNFSIESFYKTYATYLDDGVTSLYDHIDGERPDISLQKCSGLVEDALSRNEQLAGARGIYMLVDEYDAFTNNYLKPPNTVEPHKTTLDGSPVGETFRSFWCTVKLLFGEGIEKSFHYGHLTALLIRYWQCVQYSERCVISPEPSRAVWCDNFGLGSHTEGNRQGP